MDTTPSQRLATLHLGQPVHQWIAERRQAGKSWRHIARDLSEATNGEVDLTYEALRLWGTQDTAA